MLAPSAHSFTNAFWVPKPPRSPPSSDDESVDSEFSTVSEVIEDAELAKKMATDPLGPAPKDADLADLASLTVAANVLLNLDEILMKR